MTKGYNKYDIVCVSEAIHNLEANKLLFSGLLTWHICYVLLF